MEAGVGHNSEGDDRRDSAAAAKIKSFILRVERLNEDIAGLQEDRKEVFAEARGAGFDVKALKALVSLRKKSQEVRREEEELLETYKAAIGME